MYKLNTVNLERGYIMSDSDLKLVQMNMRDRTIKKIESLKKILGTDNRTDIIKTSIDIASIVSSAIHNGASVMITEKDGSKSKIVIPGID